MAFDPSFDDDFVPDIYDCILKLETYDDDIEGLYDNDIEVLAQDLEELDDKTIEELTKEMNDVEPRAVR